MGQTEKRHAVTLEINGTRRSIEVEARKLLVHLIREDFGLTGTHIGCDTSQCGACTVEVDGRATKSCTMLAVMADGASITTIEGAVEFYNSESFNNSPIGQNIRSLDPSGIGIHLETTEVEAVAAFHTIDRPEVQARAKYLLGIAIRQEEIVGVLFGERDCHQQTRSHLSQAQQGFEERIGADRPTHPVKLPRNGREDLFLRRGQRAGSDRNGFDRHWGLLGIAAFTHRAQQERQQEQAGPEVYEGNRRGGL